MADPFEVRMRFTSLIQHLNAGVTSSQKAASFALKHRDMDEDLHSCILEQLERTSLNARANIMFFIEHLCDTATQGDYPDYVRMVSRDILKIVDLVAPEDGTGAANVKVVRKVLTGMREKAYLTPATVGELEECVKDREGGADERAVSPRQKGRSEKRQIEQRIEEDRERHKRLRESIWAVDHDADKEFDRLWEETSDIDEDDLVLAREEAEERREAAKHHRLAMMEAKDP